MPLQGKINFIFWPGTDQELENWVWQMGTEFFRVSKNNLKATLISTFKIGEKDLIPFYLHQELMNKIISGIFGI